MLENSLMIVAGLAVLIWGADRFVTGASSTARNLGVPTLIIGLTIVAFATSAPEILVSIIAASSGSAPLALGNAIGSNIANIALVLGAVALLKPIEITSQTLRRELPALIAVTLLALAVMVDFTLNRLDGVILLVAMIGFLVWMIRLSLMPHAGDPIEQEFEDNIPHDIGLGKSVMWLIIGLGALLLGAEILVRGATSMARIVGVSELVIGVTLVAVGTSLPELAVSAISAMRGDQDLAIGNIVGSNIFNLLAVIGIAAFISPMQFEPQVLTLHFFVMTGFTLALFAMGYDPEGKGHVNRLEGGTLLIGFFAYHWYVLYQSFGAQPA